MTITIAQPVLYYMAISIVFETVFTAYQFKKEYEKLKKYSDTFEIIKSCYKQLKQTATFKLLFKSVFSPLTFIVMYIFFCIYAVIHFPVTIIKSIRKIFYKTELEKKAEEENRLMEEFYNKKQEFLRNENRAFVEYVTAPDTIIEEIQDIPDLTNERPLNTQNS